MMTVQCSNGADKETVGVTPTKKERTTSDCSSTCSHLSRYTTLSDSLRPPSRLRWGISRSDIQEGFEFANRKFCLIRMIGSGSYGHIWLGQNKVSGNEVAVKIEHHRRSNQLPQEQKIYQILRAGVGASGFPQLLFYGESEIVNILVMELLGCTIEDLFNRCNRKFSLKTILMLFDQMLARVEYVHSKGFVHRDIKPENIAMGLKRNQRKAHLIDFGCAKFYWQSQKTRQHIPFKTGKLGLRGSARFCSNNAHLGNELSRRDDMISLGYTIAYLLRNPLPWQKSNDQSGRTNHKGYYYDRIAAVKL